MDHLTICGDEKAWMYVGRYLQDFARLETHVEDLFKNAFGLDHWAAFRLLSSLSFAEKIDLLEAELERQQLNLTEIFKKVRRHMVLRNVIAHCVFVDEADGIEFIRADRRTGKLRLPRGIVDGDDTIVSYKILDNYHEESSELSAQIETAGIEFYSQGVGDEEELDEVVLDINEEGKIIPFPIHRRQRRDGEA